MDLQLSPDLQSAMRPFLRNGSYANETEVLLAALAALTRERNVAEIQRGVDDVEAGRCRPWEEVKADLDAKYGFGKK